MNIEQAGEASGMIGGGILSLSGKPAIIARLACFTQSAASLYPPTGRFVARNVSWEVLS